MELFLLLLLRHPSWEIHIRQASSPSAYLVELSWRTPEKIIHHLRVRVYLPWKKLHLVLCPEDWIEKELSKLEEELSGAIRKYERDSL